MYKRGLNAKTPRREERKETAIVPMLGGLCTFAFSILSGPPLVELLDAVDWAPTIWYSLDGIILNRAREVKNGREPQVQWRARDYLTAYGRFTFSIITRYEILRGLKARQAIRQVQAFADRCRQSIVLPLTDQGIVQAAEPYGDLYRQGELISEV